MKKPIKLTLISFLMTLSCAIYAIDYNAVYDRKDEIDDVVLTFMRKSQLLPKLLEDKNKNSLVNEDPKVIKELPMWGLYKKLNEKSNQLAEAEERLIVQEGGADILQRIKSNLRLAYFGTLQDIIETSRKNFKDYPALADHSILSLVLSYDLEAIDEEILSNILSFDSDSREISDAEQDELMGIIFDDEVEQYKAFVEKNREVLEKLSTLADNGFFKPKRCRTIRNKEFCISSREINNLSEIMLYINSMNLSDEVRSEL